MKSDIFSEIQIGRWRRSQWSCNWYRKRSDRQKNFEETVEISRKQSAKHRCKKEASIANSRSSWRRKVVEIELANLRAGIEAEQRQRERKFDLEQEHAAMELSRRAERKELELRLKLQQHKSELSLWQHDRDLENERKKVEAEKKRKLEIELKKK